MSETINSRPAVAADATLTGATALSQDKNPGSFGTNESPCSQVGKSSLPSVVVAQSADGGLGAAGAAPVAPGTEPAKDSVIPKAELAVKPTEGASAPESGLPSLAGRHSSEAVAGDDPAVIVAVKTGDCHFKPGDRSAKNFSDVLSTPARPSRSPSQNLMDLSNPAKSRPNKKADAPAKQARRAKGPDQPATEQAAPPQGAATGAADSGPLPTDGETPAGATTSDAAPASVDAGPPAGGPAPDVALKPDSGAAAPSQGSVDVGAAAPTSTDQASPNAEGGPRHGQDHGAQKRAAKAPKPAVAKRAAGKAPDTSAKASPNAKGGPKHGQDRGARKGAAHSAQAADDAASGPAGPAGPQPDAGKPADAATPAKLPIKGKAGKSDLTRELAKQANEYQYTKVYREVISKGFKSQAALDKFNTWVRANVASIDPAQQHACNQCGTVDVFVCACLISAQQGQVDLAEDDALLVPAGTGRVEIRYGPFGRLWRRIFHGYDRSFIDLEVVNNHHINDLPEHVDIPSVQPLFDAYIIPEMYAFIRAHQNTSYTLSGVDARESRLAHSHKLALRWVTLNRHDNLLSDLSFVNRLQVTVQRACDQAESRLLYQAVNPTLRTPLKTRIKSWFGFGVRAVDK